MQRVSVVTDELRLLFICVVSEAWWILGASPPGEYIAPVVVLSISFHVALVEVIHRPCAKIESLKNVLLQR